MLEHVGRGARLGARDDARASRASRASSAACARARVARVEREQLVERAAEAVAGRRDAEQRRDGRRDVDEVRVVGGRARA